MLTVAAGGPLLIQVGSAPTLDLSPIVAAEGVTLAPSGLPGVLRADGGDAALDALAAELAGRPGLGYVARAQTMSIDQTPNDPKFTDGTLWGLNGAHGINAPAAWDVTTGAPAIIVADIDTGIDYNHLELYQNIWINQAEIPATRLRNLTDVFRDGYISMRDLNDPSNQGPGKITDQNGDGRITAADLLAPTQLDAAGVDKGLGGWANGVSEDGDTAHVDDLVGWNFVNNTNDPLDDNGHGTHTAGTIAERGNDAVGGVGVMWQAEVMGLKFLAANGSGTDLGAALAVRYAADHGARVSNNSYGGGQGAGSPMVDAISYAATKGQVVVAAAGNNSGNNDNAGASYPATFPNDNIVAVAAIDINGNLANFSNYGATTVDLAAPGVNIYSTLPNNAHGSLSGTSMATPHVTGAIGLLLSAHPGWTYQQLIRQVLSTTTPDASVAGKTVTGGVLNIGAALAPPPPASTAAFAGLDTTTQGNWKGVYGADGVDLAADANTSPAYAVVTLVGQSNYTWDASPAGTQAPLRAAAGAGRVAATWYDGTGYSIDLNLTDGNVHKLSLYALDYDRIGRSERIDILDAGTGTVLDTRSIANFGGGAYLTWKLSGHVALRVTTLAGKNAVVSGLFFDPATPPAATAGFLGTDSATQGNWKGVYGADGVDLAADANTSPAYAVVTLVGQSNYTWDASPAGTQAPLRAAAGAGRVAATWYDGTGYSIDLNLTDGNVHKLSLYALDYDRIGRSERIDILDAGTGTVLDTRSIANFGGGAYLTWKLSGHVALRVTTLAGKNAVVSGLFFDPATPPAATAGFLGTDSATQGNWKGVYGADAASIVGDASSTPAYGTLTPSGQATYIWDGSPTDAPSLQRVSAGRIAATWYADQSETLDLNLTDGAAHKVSLYALDYDRVGRSERVDVLDAATGAVLDTRIVANFAGGQYLSWKLSGHVVLRLTNLGPKNAVVSGIFFDAPTAPAAPTASAAFVGLDAATQGNWKGVYGADGQSIQADATTVPAYAALAPITASTYTWDASPTATPALQRQAGTGRVAATWYDATGYTIDLNLTDGAAHKVSLYALDYDRIGRSERIDVVDAGTGTVLDSRTLSNFGNGQYASWKLTGHVLLRVTNLAGRNAVLSGIFFDPAI